MFAILPLIILGIVFILIAVRQIGSVRLEIWQIMLCGALAVLATGQISPASALSSINFDVLIFLFAMFIVGHALEASGYLSLLSFRIFRSAKNLDQLLLFIVFFGGIASAFLMNDMIAVIGAPLMLHLAAKHGLPLKAALLALAFSVTIGSVMSPIGNPQNLLIALESGMPNPFSTFLIYLFVPTMINLGICFLFIKFYYKGELKPKSVRHEEPTLRDPALAGLAKLSLLILLALIALKVLLVLVAPNLDPPLTYIAIASALPVIASPKRLSVIRSVDYSTLVFFAAMFVLMQSVWDTGVFQSLITGSNADISSTVSILGVSIILSQFISNVPLVALYMPLLVKLGATTKSFIALAAGSTIAGNLTLIGAASNIILIQNVEKRSEHTISFLEFAKIGIPLTIVTALVYWLFLTVI